MKMITVGIVNNNIMQTKQCNNKAKQLRIRI